MPTFGAYDSPTLQKMEGGSRFDERRNSRKLKPSRIIGDPFALATISISILAWLIAFVSSIIADIPENAFYPNFSWWSLVYSFFCILGVIVAVASGAVFTYHVAIVGFLSAGLILTTSSVDTLVYSTHGAEEAAAAGFILLSMINIVWIFYFGSQPHARHRAYIDSFALHKDTRDLQSTRSSRPMSNHISNQYGAQHPQRRETQPQSQLYNPNQLHGFETSSPVTGYPNNGDHNSSQPGFTAGGPAVSNTQNQYLSNIPISGPNASEDAHPPTEYLHSAKAIYSYEANPDDANEISFSKGEILEVSDVSGRWWQAKKATGETGIAPSNYLILL